MRCEIAGCSGEVTNRIVWAKDKDNPVFSCTEHLWRNWITRQHYGLDIIFRMEREIAKDSSS